MARDRKRPAWRRFPVATPAAGAEWTLRNDRGGVWLVRALSFRLVTDATVANRTAGVSVTGAEDVWLRTVSAAVQAASLTRTYQAFNGSPAGGDSPVAVLLAWPTDGLWVPGGHVLSSASANLAAGDQYSVVMVELVEFPEVIPVNLVPLITLYEDSESE